MRNPRRALRRDVRLAPSAHRRLGGGLAGARAAAGSDARDADRALLRRCLRPARGAGSRAVRRPATPLCRLRRDAARRRVPVLSERRRAGARSSSAPRWWPCPCSGRPFISSCTEGRFAERVLVIGTGPLARRALEAAEHRGPRPLRDRRGGRRRVGCRRRLRVTRRAPGSAVPPRPDHPDDASPTGSSWPWRSGADACPFRPCSKRGCAGS